MIDRRRFIVGSSSAVASTAVSPRSFIEASPVLTGRVVRRGDPGYDAARQDWNARLNFYPNVIVYCATIADVQNAVAYANAQHFQICMRGGIGHDFEGFSLNNGGIVIDVSSFTSVAMGASGGYARVGAGTNLGTLYHALWNAGQKSLPGGSCASVGVSGLTTGGGMGMSSRKFGLLCDRLYRVRFVDANGTLRDSATDPHGADILWAMRGGGGGSFGILTDLYFVLDTPTPEVTVYQINWRWSSATLLRILTLWMQALPSLPREASSFFVARSQQSGLLTVYGMYQGPPANITPILQHTYNGTGYISFSATQTTYINAIDHFGGSGPRRSHKFASSYINAPMSTAGLNALAAHLASTPSAEDVVQFDGYGGAINAVSPSATAFNHRSMLASLQYAAVWDYPSQAAAHLAWVSQIFGAVDPYTTRKSYRNYCDLNLSDWSTRYYGTNYARLQQIKLLLDPQNRFRYPQSITLY